MKKYIKNLDQNECIHTPTIEIADKLFEKLKNLEAFNLLKDSYDAIWSLYKEKTCFFPKDDLGIFGNINNFDENIKVYNIEDILDFQKE